MGHETILYLSDQATSSNSVSAALKAAGYEVVKTSSSREAIALLYIMQSVAGVVVNHRARQQTSFDVVRGLRSICTDVPIILLCRNQIDSLPPSVDGCVSAGQPLENLASAVRRLLNARSTGRGPCASSQHAA